MPFTSHSICLQIAEDAIFVYKGTDPDIDSYSAFWDNNKKSQTTLNEELKKKNITDVFICGIAYDVCVGEYECCGQWKFDCERIRNETVSLYKYSI